MNNPSEIAREALRQLSLQRIPPTPDNYRALYFKIAGTKADSPADTMPARLLGQLIAALPRRSLTEEKLALQCSKALEEQQWPLLNSLLSGALGKASGGDELRWDKLVGGLIEKWDTRLSGLTTAQKKAALDRVLAGKLSNEILYEKLQGLLNQWGTRNTADNSTLIDEAAAPAPGTPPTASLVDPSSDTVRQVCASILDTVIVSAVAESSALADDARELAQKIRGLSAKNADEILAALRRFALRMEYFGEDQQELKAGLLHLLQLVVDNIGELVIDDRWVSGQLEVLSSLVAAPMDIRSIDNAERRLKEVIYKQSHLKQSLVEAQSTIKTMLAGFVDQLSSFAQSTGAYHDKIDLCARKIDEAADIGQLKGVIGDVMRETRTIQYAAQRMHDELVESRARVIETEGKIAELEKALISTSEMMRHDQLTGALNRRGLEEVFDKEISRAKRQQSPLCLGVLDIDNFKKLNDSLGHEAGDAALTHLVGTVRDALRPQDTVARYGGEEFVVLLPNTALAEAKEVLIRVQRELTKHYFLHNNQKILITFSAGVTQLPPDETRDQAIKRADELMYQAKHSGKNKVVAA
jgi:diguanylate cyclase